MDLTTALWEQIQNFAAGAVSLEALHDWLAAHEPAIAPDSEADDLADELWTLFRMDMRMKRAFAPD